MLELITTWRTATAHLFAFATPETLDEWYESAKVAASKWPEADKATASVKANDGTLVREIFRDEFRTELLHRVARIEEMREDL